MSHGIAVNSYVVALNVIVNDLIAWLGSSIGMGTQLQSKVNEP